jgi:hypothetical protein
LQNELKGTARRIILVAFRSILIKSPISGRLCPRQTSLVIKRPFFRNGQFGTILWSPTPFRSHVTRTPPVLRTGKWSERQPTLRQHLREQRPSPMVGAWNLVSGRFGPRLRRFFREMYHAAERKLPALGICHSTI